jgi:L-fucose isomerase-like protein
MERIWRMITPRVGFVTYGVHKDGLLDPLGTPFIDEALIDNAKRALTKEGLALVEHDTIVASKAEARACFSKMKKMDDLDAVILFSGTWVWAAHLIAPLRDLAAAGKGILLWTNPGSQGWRTVGGLVMHGALKEIGIRHRFVYGSHDDPTEISKVVSYCRASHEKNVLNMSTVGVFGGRGMGQTCGVADPSQWMRVFGIDIDSRDSTEVVKAAMNITREEINSARGDIQPSFADPLPQDELSERSVRLYLALRKILKDEHWEFYTIQSFPGIGDDYTATCFAQSMILNDGIGTSTLGDLNTAITVKLLTDLSNERVYYGDLQHIDKSRNEIKIIGDGACPPSLASDAGPARFAEHGIPTEGHAGGISVKLTCKPGEGVLARLGRTGGEFEMVLVRCSVFIPPQEELAKRQRECGIPFWPHAFATVHCDADKLVNAWNNEYAVLGYGNHLYEELRAFCELTGITVIAL